MSSQPTSWHHTTSPQIPIPISLDRTLNDPIGDNNAAPEVEAFSGTAHRMDTAKMDMTAYKALVETPFDGVGPRKIVVDSTKPTVRVQFVFIGGRKEAVTVNLDTTVAALYGHSKALSVRLHLLYLQNVEILKDVEDVQNFKMLTQTLRIFRNFLYRNKSGKF